MKSIIGILMLCGILFLGSCKTEEKESRILITVKHNGNPLDGAVVKLSGQPSDTVYVNRLSLFDLEQTTNSDGVATFTFNDFYNEGDNGFAFLIVEVEATAQTQEGFGKVKIEKDETIETEISVGP